MTGHDVLAILIFASVVAIGVTIAKPSWRAAVAAKIRGLIGR